MVKETLSTLTTRAGIYDVVATGTHVESPFQTGITGEQDTVNHPYPFTIPGPWAQEVQRNDPGYASGSYFRSGSLWLLNEARVQSPVASIPPALIGGDTLSQVLARSNPSKPVVDLPIFMAEAREIPQLVYIAGRDYARRHAKRTLQNEFGWKPLMSDLRKLLDFQKLADRRVQELSDLYRKGGLKFRADLAQSSYVEPEVVIGPTTHQFDYAYRRSGSAKRWCVVKWVPSWDARGSIPPLDVIRYRAIRAMLGGTVDASTIWELIPWSWLIDWFSDVGSWLSMRRNIVGFVPGQCMTMTQTEALTLGRLTPRLSSWSGSVTPPVYWKRTKSRTIGVPSLPTADVPILTNRHFSILASLAVLRK